MSRKYVCRAYLHIIHGTNLYLQSSWIGECSYKLFQSPNWFVWTSFCKLGDLKWALKRMYGCRAVLQMIYPFSLYFQNPLKKKIAPIMLFEFLYRPHLTNRQFDVGSWQASTNVGSIHIWYMLSMCNRNPFELEKEFAYI